MGVLNTLIREPLIHFMLAGAVLFTFFYSVNPAKRQSSNSIIIDQNRVAQLQAHFKRVWSRPPSPEETTALIDNYITEELFYREAKKLSLDQNDAVIRQRLRQKMEYLAESLSESIPPTDTELESYLASNASLFKGEAKYSFEQIFIRGDHDAAHFNQRVNTAQKALSENIKFNGDASLLPRYFEGATGYEVDRQLGKGFSQQLNTLDKNEWQGPLKSGLGAHFVKLSARKAGAVPLLSEIKPAVTREWINERAKERKSALIAHLKKQYTVEDTTTIQAAP